VLLVFFLYLNIYILEMMNLFIMGVNLMKIKGIEVNEEKYPMMALHAKEIQPFTGTLVGKDKAIEGLFATYDDPIVSNAVLLAPPGTGKTTLMKGMAHKDKKHVYLEAELSEMITGLRDNAEMGSVVKNLFNEIADFGKENNVKLGLTNLRGEGIELVLKDGEDKKSDKSETPVNPTEGNHSVDDKSNKPDTPSKPADNNQPSTNKEDKPATPTNPDSPVRNPFPYFTDRPSNDNNSSDDHHVEVPAKPSTESSVGDRRPVAQATEIASPVPEAIVATGPTVSTTPVKEESVTETEAPKPAKSEEEVQSHGVAKADEVTKSDESSKDNNTKVAAKLATTPKTPSDSEGSKSNILSILATIFAAIASLALLGYGLVTGKIHLPKK